MRNLLLSALTVSLLVGCTPPAPKVSVSADDKALILTKPESVSGESAQDLEKMSRDNMDMLSKKQFGKLEEEAASLRKSKQAYASGRWKLDTFYRSFSELSRGKLKENAYKERIGLLEEWIKTRPNDIASKVALAGLYQKYAWFARGGGYANTVSDEGWKLMAERNKTALGILTELRGRPQRDPRMYYLLLQIAKDESFEKDKYAEIFDASVKEFPTYRSSYFAKVLDLQPRWGGEDGEWEGFAKETADKVGGEEGDKLYAQMIWAVLYTGWYRGDNLFGTFKLDAKRALKGMDALRKQYPKSLEALSAHCSMAVQSGDYETAAKLFQELEGQVDNSVWHGVKNFVYWRDLLFK